MPPSLKECWFGGTNKQVELVIQESLKDRIYYLSSDPIEILTVPGRRHYSIPDAVKQQVIQHQPRRSRTAVDDRKPPRKRPLASSDLGNRSQITMYS